MGGLAFGMLFMVWIRHMRAPRYDGRTVTQWIDTMDDSHQNWHESVAYNDPAFMVLTNWGPAIVPELVKVIQAGERTSDDSAAGRLLASIKESLNSYWRFDSRIRTVEERSFRAQVVLSALGPAASNAVPALVEIAEGELDGARQPNNWIELEVIGAIHSNPDVCVPLLMKLASKEDNEGLYAIWALGQFGAEASEAVPLLRDLMKTPDRDVQFEAACSICRIDPSGCRDALALLIGVWSERPEDVGHTAVRFIGEIGPGAKSAVPFLVNLFGLRRGGWMRQEIVATLEKIDPDTDHSRQLEASLEAAMEKIDPNWDYADELRALMEMDLERFRAEIGRR